MKAGIVLKKVKMITAAMTAAAVLFSFSAFADSSGNTFTTLTAEEDIIGGAAYSTVLYNSSNGLPTSEANAVIQTRDGFVWIGSYSGLIRYDGSSFYRYDASNGVPNAISLFEDSKDRLWIGTNDNGIVCYENGVFTPYGNTEGMKSPSIRAIAEDKDGNIIIGTKMGAAYINTSGALHILDDPQLDTEDIRELFDNGSGIIYGHTNTGAFFTFEDLAVTSFYTSNSFDFGQVCSVCPDKDNKGYAYFGTEGSSLVRADISNGMKDITVLDVSPLVSIKDVEYAGNDLWLCADNGIGMISRDGGFKLLEDVPMDNNVDDVMFDYEGNMWFASSRQGVMKISHSDFTDISRIAGLEDLVVNATCLCGTDLYIGTDTGLYIYDTITKLTKTNELTGELANARVRCIKADSKGNIWLSTYSGLYCAKDGKPVRLYDDMSGLASNKVRASEEMSDGRTVVSVIGGVHIIKDGRIVTTFGEDSGLRGAEILSICEGDDGKIYLGGNGTGLYIVDGDNITRISRSFSDDACEGLRSNVIMRIKKDPYTGLYWLITGSSIAYMKDEKITTVSEFPYSNNFDIFFGGDGSVWILSSNGIYVTTTEDLVRNSDIEYLFFDSNCGLTSVATANSRSCMSENGDLYIAGSEGVNHVNLASLKSEPSDIRLRIPFIDIDGTLMSVKTNGSITVPSDAKRITVYGYALTYSLKNPRVSYRLTGFDSEPVTTFRRDLKPVSYTNLKGGTYTFNLSLLDPLTGEESRSVSVMIVKEQAFYENIWFQLVLIFAAVILIAVIIELIHRKREAALIKEQQRKQLLIDEMIQAFAKCVDMKDNYTNGHSFRVAEYSRMIAEKCGKSELEAKDVYNVALLHDIGKISIPDNVLNKDGRPTDEEYAILKSHAKNGYEVLKTITIAPELSYGAGYHHERLDGKGYPNGLKGDEIPEVAQMIAVADTFDAMYSTRPYRKQMDVNDVIAELRRVSGTQLNGKFVECLASLVEEGKIEQRKL